MKMYKKKFVLLFTLIVVMGLIAACGDSDVEQVGKVSDNPQSEETVADTTEEPREQPEEEPEEEPEEVKQTTFKLGDTVIINDSYTITILGVTETEERNEYSDKEVSQVLIIEYMYENIASEDEDIYITDSNFKFIDQQGNMCDTYPVGGDLGPEHTPVGAKTFTTMTIGTVEQSDSIKLLYYDNMFDSNALFDYELTIGETIEADFSGVLPKYDNMFNLGEEVEITTAEGVYTIVVNSVTKTSDRNQFSEKDPGAVFIIDYSYKNISMDDDLYVSDYNFRIIDDNGNMGYSYPARTSKSPQDTIKGAKTTADMAFGTHVDSNSIVLCYSDNMFSDKADVFFLIEGLN